MSFSDSTVSGYLHCQRCLDELPDGVSPAEYANLCVGVSSMGDLVIQCYRHNLEVAVIPNDECAEFLLQVAGLPCEECEKGEIKH